MIIPKQKLSIFFFILIFSFSFLSSSVIADDCSDECEEAYPIDSDLRESCEDKCKDLEKQRKNVLNLLKINDKTQDALSTQLLGIEEQQNRNRSNLNKVQQKIENTQEKIKSLERDIIEKEKQIEYQKRILSGLMQSYYDYDQQGILELILWNKELAASLNQIDYIEQSGAKASEVLFEIKDNQKKLNLIKIELEEDQKENEGLKDQLEYEKNNLAASENQKTWLLEKTQGEEEKYEAMLEHIEEQKKELFDFSGASNIDEILESVKDYPKPDKKYWASTSWFFMQTDSRWANQKIGNSKSLMKDWGCAVTSVAMVFRKHGSSTDPGKLAKEKIYSSDLIKWPASWSPNIALISSVSHGNVNWNTIKSNINSGNPVIVYIKRTSGGGGHYVVVTGKDSKDYIVHDPYFGSNLYLGTSMSLIGKLGTNSKTKIDQMIIYN